MLQKFSINGTIVFGFNYNEQCKVTNKKKLNKSNKQK